MEVSSSHQMYVFFLSVLSGVGCGVFFDLQRSLRKLHFAGGLRTTIEDIFFVTVALGVMIALGFFFNNGQIRYYQVMGSVSGALFYAAFLSRSVMKLLSTAYSIFGKIVVRPVVRLFKVICIPVGRMWNLINSCGNKLRKKGKTIVKNIKRGKKHLKKRIKML